MTDQKNDEKQPENDKKNHEEGRLEQLGRVLDPIAPKIPNQDLNDPGRMTPGAPPVDNRT